MGTVKIVRFANQFKESLCQKAHFIQKGHRAMWLVSCSSLSSAQGVNDWFNCVIAPNYTTHFRILSLLWYQIYSCWSVGSKHILNAQVSIRSPCCRLWFDCAECHAETQDHPLAKTMEMVFMCKKCRKAFRKDMSGYEESDEYCPHCDNHYVCTQSKW